ncbi:MAG TPA: hypothetical protein VJK54_09500, partial [Chthoniobacterales bacterium]|nr:hypothetical protein [Chthoniobacterales bacterium]
QKGHLFAGRYKSLLVDESDNHYLRIVCDYVHLNPARAHLIKEGELLQSYQWSSFNSYLSSPHKRPSWLRVDRLLGEHITKDNTLGRKNFAILMNQRISQQVDNEILYKIIRRGWKIGAKDFIERLHSKIENYVKKENHFMYELHECQESIGRRLIAEQLQKLKLTLDALELLPRTDPIKIEIARFIRSQTTLPLEWLASELRAGSPRTLANSLCKDKKRK